MHFLHITSSIIRASLNEPHISMYNDCILSGIIICVCGCIVDLVYKLVCSIFNPTHALEQVSH